MNLQGKCALVTGGGRGIGKAIALGLAKAGASVWVCGRGEEPLKEVARECGGNYLVCDLSDRKSTDELLARLAAEAPTIDILINNAGIATSAPYYRVSDEDWDRLMEVNALAPFRLIRALAPKMVPRGYGRIVNIASNAGVSGYAYTSAYCASKHAMVGYTRAIAVELAKTPVTINAVCPGWVDTDMVADSTRRITEKTGRSEEEARAQLASMTAQNRIIAPEEVAHLVLSLCAEEARGIHGQSMVIDGGNILR